MNIFKWGCLVSDKLASSINAAIEPIVGFSTKYKMITASWSHGAITNPKTYTLNLQQTLINSIKVFNQLSIFKRNSGSN